MQTSLAYCYDLVVHVIISHNGQQGAARHNIPGRVGQVGNGLGEVDLREGWGRWWGWGGRQRLRCVHACCTCAQECA